MSYINSLQLISGLVKGESLDSIKLLSEVDRSKIDQALSKSKFGLPRSFYWTSDPIEEANVAKMPRRDKQQLWDIYRRLAESKERSAEELPKLIALREKYPNVPAVHNYIGLAYANQGKLDEYYQTIHETHKRFPDYLFGKLSVAEYYIGRGRHKEVPAIFSNKLEIYMHYPENTFAYHVSEVRAFYGVVGTYYARSKKTAQAIRCYFIVHEVAPEHWSARRLADEIVQVEIAKLQQKLQDVRRR